MDKKFTEKELFQWMWEQPDDRLVNMYCGTIGSDCSCLLAQFLEAHGYRKGYICVNGEYTLSQESIEYTRKFSFSRETLFDYFESPESHETFGALKKNFKANKN